MAHLSFARVRVAAQPINWINDDFRDLGASTSLDECLREMKEAGYDGTELGHRFPADAPALRALLERHGLRLASGWHSTYVVDGDHDREERAFVQHARKLQACGADVVIVAECTRAIHGDGKTPLVSGRPRLAPQERRRLAQGLERLARVAASMGMRAAYHPHMGTVVQDAADVDTLMNDTQTLALLLDAGHLRFAGSDPLAVLERHGARVAHVHTKDVRAGVAHAAFARDWTFEQAVRAGVFTVPGDGAIDFAPLFAALEKLAYGGWLVVEAEQDPAKAPPLAYARRGRAHVRQWAGV